MTTNRSRTLVVSNVVIKDTQWGWSSSAQKMKQWWPRPEREYCCRRWKKLLLHNLQLHFSSTEFYEQVETLFQAYLNQCVFWHTHHYEATDTTYCCSCHSQLLKDRAQQQLPVNSLVKDKTLHILCTCTLTWLTLVLLPGISKLALYK